MALRRHGPVAAEGPFREAYEIARKLRQRSPDSPGVRKTEARTQIEYGEILGTLKGHKNRVKCISFSRDGTTLASGSMDHTIKLWDVDGREEKKTLRAHSDDVRSVAFLPDGKTLAAGGAQLDLVEEILSRLSQVAESSLGRVERVFE